MLSSFSNTQKHIQHNISCTSTLSSSAVLLMLKPIPGYRFVLQSRIPVGDLWSSPNQPGLRLQQERLNHGRKVLQALHSTSLAAISKVQLSKPSKMPAAEDLAANSATFLFFVFSYSLIPQYFVQYISLLLIWRFCLDSSAQLEHL